MRVDYFLARNVEEGGKQMVTAYINALAFLKFREP